MTPLRAALVRTVVALATVAVLPSGQAGAAAPSVRAGGASPGAEKAASESTRRARHLYESAEAHFNAGRFAEALAEYQAGYEAAALPGFLINIAQCQRRLGDLANALTTYRKFILVAPDSPFVPQVKVLVTELEKLGPELARDGERDADASSSAGAPGGEAGRAAGTHGNGPALSLRQDPTAVGDPSRLVETNPSAPAPPRSSKKWWIVGGIAVAALAGGTAAIFALRSGDTTTVHEGSLGTLRR